MNRVAAALALMLWAVVAVAQAPPAAPPTFSVSAHLVQIRAMVRDKNGPVAGLSKDDFVLTDRGIARDIRIFSADSTGTHNIVNTPPPNTFSDAPQYGPNSPASISIVLLDNLNTLYGSSPVPYESTPYWLEDLALANAKAHLIQFVQGLDSKDRVAIYGLSDSLHVLCDFTNDREQLLAIVKAYDPNSRTSRATVEPGVFHTPVPGPEFNGNMNEEAARFAAMANANRAMVTMAALAAIADHVAQIPARKNLVWLTANLPFSGEAMARVLAPAQIAAYMVDARGLLTRNLGPPDMDGDAAARGNFPLAQSPQPVGIETMRELAEETGGKAFVNTNDLTGAIREAVEGSTANYTLGFYLDAASLDGKFHPLKLQVKRTGVTLRYPKGYFALTERPATEDQDRNKIIAAVRSPLQSSAILVQAKLDRVGQPQPNLLKIVTSVDIHSVQLERDGELRNGAIKVHIIEQDATGKVLHESTQGLNLHLTEKQYADYLQSGISFLQYVQPKRDATTLRLLVQDAGTTAIGSLIIPLSEIK